MAIAYDNDQRLQGALNVELDLNMLRYGHATRPPSSGMFVPEPRSTPEQDVELLARAVLGLAEYVNERLARSE